MAHLLLVVVLALGVFVMHTATGHTSGAKHAHSAQADHNHSEGSKHSQHSEGSGTSLNPALHFAPDPGTGMDRTSLCVCVLGTWAFAALLRAAFARRPGWLADVLAKAVVILRPNPPPRGPDLTLLSILRI